MSQKHGIDVGKISLGKNFDSFLKQISEIKQWCLKRRAKIPVKVE